MATIPIPFTEESVDTEEGTDAGLKIGLLILGFMLFSAASALGAVLWNMVSEGVEQATGVDIENPTADDGGVPGV